METSYMFKHFILYFEVASCLLIPFCMYLVAFATCTFIGQKQCSDDLCCLGVWFFVQLCAKQTMKVYILRFTRTVINCGVNHSVNTQTNKKRRDNPR